MVAISSSLAILVGALATLGAAAPTASPANNTIAAYGSSEALALQIFVHHVTDADAGKLCASDADCKKAMDNLNSHVQKQQSKRKIPGLSLFGGPWGLAYSLAMSTDEGQKVHGYAVSFLRGICNSDKTCAEALSAYDKYIQPVVNKVDDVETDAENAVLGKIEDVVESII